MAEAISQTNLNQSIEERVKDHAQKTFSLAADKIEFMKLGEDAALPGVERFYISQKNRNHGGDYVYLVWNDRLYCSGVKEDFSRFLKDREFLKNPDARQFQTILLELNRLPDQLVIEQKDIDKPDEDIAPFVGKIAAPKLTENEAGGAVFTFFTQMVGGKPIQKFVVTVAPDYAVKFDTSFVQ